MVWIVIYATALVLLLMVVAGVFSTVWWIVVGLAVLLILLVGVVGVFAISLSEAAKQGDKQWP